MDQKIVQQIVDSINSATPTSIEFIPGAIGQRIRRRNESIVDIPSELRRHSRRAMLTSALAVRLTDRLYPFGSPFQVFIKDISASGLGFVHTRHWPETKIAIRLENVATTEASVFVVGIVRRSFCMSGVYEIGLEFCHTFRADRIYVLPEAPTETPAETTHPTDAEDATPLPVSDAPIASAP
ncbi:PilZ domain-containing protein [bacterium]|nr:PilZ domain-containing protein [bacterium]